jgi:hypothetical protein
MTITRVKQPQNNVICEKKDTIVYNSAGRDMANDQSPMTVLDTKPPVDRKSDQI